METTITINLPRELLVIKQDKTEILVNLREVKLKAIGFPSKRQLQTQPMAVATMLTAIAVR